MKKLLAAFCCILYLHGVAQAPFDVKATSPKSSAEKVLIKALVVIVNREGHKKTPVKKVTLPSSGKAHL